MATNRFFNQFTFTPEQNLLDDLTRECIQIHGIDVLYLPRHLQKEDLIYGEDVLSKFDDYFDIEMYIKNIDGFEGSGDLFRKFGLEISDEATLIVSQTRFREVVGDDIQPPRPREGDLIFFPLNNALFEIKFTTQESIYYQLGNTYIYEMTIRQYVYSHEEIKTGITDVDEATDPTAFSFLLGLGAGSGIYLEKEKIYQGTSLATATAIGTVLHYNQTNNTIKIKDIIGEFTPGVNLIGEQSGASYNVTTFDDMDIKQDASAQNKEIQDETNQFVDFTERDPFSEDDY